MNGWDFATYWMTRFDWMVALGTVITLGAVLVFWWMARTESSQFKFAEMFIGDDGKTSMGKFLAFLAGLSTTWIVIALATKTNELSWDMFGLYIVTMITGKVASEFVAAKKVVERDKVVAGIADPQPEPQGGSVDLQMSVKSTETTAAPRAPRRPLGKVTQGGSTE